MNGDDAVTYAIKNLGMMTLAESAARKMLRGLTAYNEVEHLLAPRAQSQLASQLAALVGAQVPASDFLGVGAALG